MKIQLGIMAIAVALFFVSCEKDSQDQGSFPIPKTSDGITIKTGSYCGMCVGFCADSLLVRNGYAELKLYSYWPKEELVVKSIQLEKSAWDKIVSNYNSEAFKKLNYNEHPSYADGCDEWIEVADGRSSHSISFDPQRNIQEIEDLRVCLGNLKSRLKNLD